MATASDLKTLAFLSGQVRRLGDHPAVIQFTREGKNQWPGARLGEAGEAVGRALVELGVRPGEAIAIIAEPSPEWMVAALGILGAGGVLVPVDTQMADNDLVHILEDSGAGRAFATGRHARRLRDLGRADLEMYLLDENLEETEGTKLHDLGRLGASSDATFPSPVGVDERVILFYTSGTTGPPKGVPLSHRNLLSQIEAVKKTGLIRGSDRLLLPLPLHHVYPLVIGMLTPLALGVPILLPHALTGDALVRALNEGCATVILGVPRLYRALFDGIRANAGASGTVRARLFANALSLARRAKRSGWPIGRFLFRPVRKRIGPSVRLLASGGSPLDPVLAEDLEAFGWPTAVGYGLTETSPLLTIKMPGEGRYESVGRPIDSVELRVDPVDSFKAEPGKPGDKCARGEILARGPNVFSGYHHLEKETAKALVNGWFRTGDLGCFDDEGYLFLRGRASSMIVLEGGENINPEDLEERYGACGEVAEIGILEERGKLVALVHPAREVLRKRDREEMERVVAEALRKRGATLPSYKRLSHLEISRQPLPTTRLGKIQRHHLKERYAAARAGEEEGGRKTGPVRMEDLPSEVRVLLEEPRVRKLWEFLAERYAEKRLAPETDLETDLGIDSLEWVELSLAVRQRAGVGIDEEMIGRVETVRDLLEAVASASEKAGAGRRPLENPEDVLSEADQRWAQPRGSLRLTIGSVLYAVLRLVVALRCRIEVRGLQNLPQEGACLLIPNHVSFFDAPALGLALGLARARRYFWAGRGDLLFRNPFWRWLSRLCQIVPIDPKRGPLSSLAIGALVLKRGQPLVWFPEGGISTDGRLREFQSGVGLMVNVYAPTVVPIFLEGTRDVMPPEEKTLRPGRVVVHVGEPLDGRQLKEEAARASAEKAHEWIAQELHKVVEKMGRRVEGERVPKEGGEKAA